MKTRMRSNRQSEMGFTLIELLVVVMIIGVLSSIAFPWFLRQDQRSSLTKLIDLTSGHEIVLNAEQMKDIVSILDGLGSESSEKKCLSGDELGTDPFYTALVSKGNTSIPSDRK